ncbi:MAG: hypothetical protein FJ090_18775 [Deltaproteobacteria bacterium]|nr:hypothetical protein [Deltaproteobacteria bacterium]MBM4393173.1 hypothetical protein [Deltaproteobacteria bacterium]
MGLRDTLKKKVQGLVNRMSGEYSAVAPEEIKPMDRPGVADPNAKVIRARLNRPKEGAGGGSED